MLGAPRVHKQLRREDYPVARCTVSRLMADMGLRGVRRGKKSFTTTPDAAASRPPDLVERRFVAERPNALWLADITYASTWEGWLYVAFILDVYSRAIVGWQIADHLRTDLVLDALEMAIWRRDLDAGGLVHHSDVGCQYTSIHYTDRLRDVGIAGRSAPSAIRTTVRPRHSTARSRPSSSHCTARGAPVTSCASTADDRAPAGHPRFEGPPGGTLKPRARFRPRVRTRRPSSPWRP